MRRECEFQADIHSKKICGEVPMISVLAKLSGMISKDTGTIRIKNYLSLLLIPVRVLCDQLPLVSLWFNIPILIINWTWLRLLRSEIAVIKEKEIALKEKEMTPRPGFFNWLRYNAYNTYPSTKDRIKALRN